jgi:hypothetical protein
MNWEDAMDLAFQLGLMDNYGNTYVYNSDFREGRTQTCRSAGSIMVDGGGMYTVTNASTATEITDLNEDEVDDALEELGVADCDWAVLLLLEGGAV